MMQSNEHENQLTIYQMNNLSNANNVCYLFGFKFSFAAFYVLHSKYLHQISHFFGSTEKWRVQHRYGSLRYGHFALVSILLCIFWLQSMFEECVL